MIPAWFLSRAGTTSVSTVKHGENFSYLLLAPPPTMIRSGRISSSSLQRYSFTRPPHSSQLRPFAFRTLSAAYFSATRPFISMWPNSVLGTSAPSTNREVPMPVPRVAMTTTPSRSRPAP